MLVCYARELKEGFGDYVDQVSELMIPLLKFYFHDGVRSAAAECLPFLLECSGNKGPEHVAIFWRTICDKLLEALKAEPENEIQSELISSFSKSIELLGDGCLDDVMMTATLETMEYLFEQHFKRQTERSEKRKDEDYDEGVEEMLQDEHEGDVHLLSKIADMIHALFTVYRSNFLQAFDKIVQHVVKLLPRTDQVLIANGVFASLMTSSSFVGQILVYTPSVCSAHVEVLHRPGASSETSGFFRAGNHGYIRSSTVSKSLHEFNSFTETSNSITGLQINSRRSVRNGECGFFSG